MIRNTLALALVGLLAGVALDRYGAHPAPIGIAAYSRTAPMVTVSCARWAHLTQHAQARIAGYLEVNDLHRHRLRSPDDYSMPSAAVIDGVTLEVVQGCLSHPHMSVLEAFLDDVGP
jgi:hypothetical protein